MRELLKPSLNWLLVMVPVTAYLHLTGGSHTAIFVCACVAIIPLAGWLGKGTEHLAERTSETLGGLLNATFGNAAELIIALVALNKGLYDVVKASLTGSIIGNILLVLGAAIFAGGLRHKVQTFNPAGARTQATMLVLAAISMIMPAAFHHLAGPAGVPSEDDLSLEISVVLMAIYATSLLFTLHTHRQLFVSHTEQVTEPHTTPWPLWRAFATLAVSTALIAWISEMLVGSVEEAAHAFGMSSIFVGVIVVAVVGNAAEHSTAILVAVKNRMDMSIGIAVGSSVQIALFVSPLLVFASYFIGPRPMDLVFTPAEVLAVIVSVLIVTEISGDGESNWMEGLQLLAVYLILAFVFYLLPEAH
jgi:Ca2+:H+ antiporter